MALERSIWLKEIREQLFKDNAFLNKAKNWDEHVQAGVKTVVIPQSGSASGVERNRSSFPALSQERTDSDISYDMVDYTTNPKRVREIEKVQLSYPKLQSVISQDMANIKEYAAEDILYSWRPEAANRIVRTSGDAVDATISGVDGATGNRKRYKLADLLVIDKMMNTLNIPQSGRVALLSASAKQDLLLDPDIKGNPTLSALLANYTEGAVLRIAGFEIFVRSTALRYTNASTPVAKLPSALAATTDNDASLFWHPDFVGRSVGNMWVFHNPGQAEHFGDILSMEVMAGGRKAETDGKGVVALVQAAAA